MNVILGPETTESRRILLEVSLLMALTLIFTLTLPGEYGTAVSLLPIGYFLIERRRRGRSWKEVGFDRTTAIAAIKGSWQLIALVGVAIPLVMSFVASQYIPEIWNHIQGRIPLDPKQLTVMLPLIIVASVGEEIAFRALFQDRLRPFIGVTQAIVLTSVVFGLMHYASGPALIVGADIAMVIVDSLIYGTIFAKTRNIYAAWFAHALANTVALAMLFVF